MVVYLDMIFLLNGLSDALALYITARLAGLIVRPRAIAGAAMIGSIYAIACALPPAKIMENFLPHVAVAGLMVRLAFGPQKAFLRYLVLFFVLSCTIGGTMMAFSNLLSLYGVEAALKQLNWKVFFLVSIACYIILSIIFKNGIRHAVAGEILEGAIEMAGQVIPLQILMDTGHTLTDPYTGAPVLTVYWDSVKNLWTGEEQNILIGLETMGADWCASNLGQISPGRFRLLPYRAVGISAGLLLCTRADGLQINGRDLGTVTIALSPTPVSDGGGYTALWGGERGHKDVA